MVLISRTRVEGGVCKYPVASNSHDCESAFAVDIDWNAVMNAELDEASSYKICNVACAQEKGR